MTNTEQMTEALKIIQANGGTVKRSYFSGWLGGVKGLRLSVVEMLVESGQLAVSRETVTKRTKRSKALPITITTYTVVNYEAFSISKHF